ncbi:MAG: putative sugar O-methyltransferase [Elusimicrobia bacterium]|nr:putative sugar O-methyltransferase [Elusimicrobiota bacterium]
MRSHNVEPAPSGLSKSDWKGALWRPVKVVTLRAGLILGTLASNLRLKPALQGDWRRRYEKTRRDFMAADSAFRPSRQWSIISAFYRLVLRGKGLEDFKSTFGRFLSTYEPNNPWMFPAVHHLYYQLLKGRDAWGVLDELEEPSFGGGTVVDYGGRPLSLDLLQSVDELYRIVEHAGFKREDRVVFCEIGAGYGRLADLVLRVMPNASFLIVDLPESLLLSQYYLTALHAKTAAALYPESSEALAGLGKPGGPRLVFALPHQLQSVPANSIDVLVNVYSFMEMGRAQIDRYFQLADDIQVGFLYLKQHKREANIYDGALNSGENYPVRASWKRLYQATTVLFEHAFEAVYRVRAR